MKDELYDFYYTEIGEARCTEVARYTNGRPTIKTIEGKRYTAMVKHGEDCGFVDKDLVFICTSSKSPVVIRAKY